MYQAKFGWHPWRLDFLLLLFFHQDKKRPSTEGEEVWPGTSRIVEGLEFLRLLTSKHVPGQIWLASLTPWSSFASFLLSRQEKALCRGRGSFSGFLENGRKSQISRITYPQTCTKSNLAGVPDALIFFCLLFFYQDKKRPSAEGGEVFPGTSRIAEGPESLRLLDSKFMRSRMAPR